MSMPKDRAKHAKRVVDPRDHAPEGWNDLTPEQMDEMDKQAESGHESMNHAEGTENLFDKASQSKPPF